VRGGDVVRLRHDTITVRVGRAGSYRVAIRDDDGGWRRLDVPRAGAATVVFP
jgi:hypothetical protein